MQRHRSRSAQGTSIDCAPAHGGRHGRDGGRPPLWLRRHQPGCEPECLGAWPAGQRPRRGGGRRLAERQPVRPRDRLHSGSYDGVPVAQAHAGVRLRRSRRPAPTQSPPAPPRIILPGEAFFQPSLFHTHANPSTTKPNRWYFIALWPTAERRAPLVSSAANVIYESPDLDPSTMPPGPRIETLRLVTLQPNGRSAAHRFSGLELLFVLEGTIRLDVAGQPPTKLSAG